MAPDLELAYGEARHLFIAAHRERIRCTGIDCSLCRLMKAVDGTAGFPFGRTTPIYFHEELPSEEEPESRFALWFRNRLGILRYHAVICLTCHMVKTRKWYQFWVSTAKTCGHGG